MFHYVTFCCFLCRRMPLPVTKQNILGNELFSNAKPAFDQQMHHATTFDAEREIVATQLFKGSKERSDYDGSLPEDCDDEAGHLAYFALSSDELAPFSAFPRHLEPGSRTRMALVDLSIIDDLLSRGSKIYHVATTPSQTGMWTRRRYHTHLVVARTPFDKTFSTMENCLELDPEHNDIFYRTFDCTKQSNTWHFATKVLEKSEDGSTSVRSIQVVLGFAGGLTIHDSSVVRWIDSFKYKTVGRADERKFQCPCCDFANAYSKGLHEHYLRTHAGTDS